MGFYTLIELKNMLHWGFILRLRSKIQVPFGVYTMTELKNVSSIWGFITMIGLQNVPTTVMRRLTTGIRSQKCVVRRFRRCANVIE
jgi:hypothetical protein